MVDLGRRRGRTGPRWALALLGVLAGCGVARADAVAPRADVVKEAGERFDFALWGRLLGRYVDGQGRVDYARLRASAEDRRSVEVLYAQVATQKVEGMAPAAKKAFLIDAYNVIVWKNVLDNQPGRVDEGLYKFFRRDYQVAGRKLDLDALEKKWIRSELADPRVHMALNCASGGCPMLPQDAFTPGEVEAQLEREARKFCNEPRNVSYDPASRTVRLSRIFDWYAADFDKQPIAWINRRRAPEHQIPGDAKVQFVDYDWHLNDPSLKR